MTKILTYSGEWFNLESPHTHAYSIADIAVSLSRIVRWNGHTKFPYSVARHSLEVCELVPPEHQLAALLHDAAEAYIGDISTPVKELLPDIKYLEMQILTQIGNQFGFDTPLHETVKNADETMQATEWRDLMPHGGKACPLKVQPLKSKVVSFWDSRADAHDFLAKYREIKFS